MIFRKIAEWLSGSKKTDQPHPLDGPIRAAEEKTFAPYKVEPPAPAPVVETKPVETIHTISEPTKCGCGRSPTGLCVGLHRLTTEEWSAHADNPARVVMAAPEVKAEEKPAKKPAAKKPKTDKPAAKKAPAKKPAAAKKAPAKKPAAKKKADAVAQAPARKTTTRKSK